MNGSFISQQATALLLLTVLCLFCATPGAAQSPTGGLSPEQQRFRAVLIEINELNRAKRYSEALERLADAEAMNVDEALVENVRGSVLTSLRSFDKARASFERARELKPNAFEPKFNLAELEFVEEKYDKAEATFTALLKEFPKLPMQPRHLALFKVLVSQLKQGRVAEATATSKAFTSMDDTPAHYFAQAAFAFQKGEAVEAHRWVESAQRVFNANDMVPYLDTIMEAKWLKSLALPEGL